MMEVCAASSLRTACLGGLSPKQKGPVEDRPLQLFRVIRVIRGPYSAA
jgi:hypothetical protein